jgi:hypothetical protein
MTAFRAELIRAMEFDSSSSRTNFSPRFLEMYAATVLGTLNTFPTS